MVLAQVVPKNFAIWVGPGIFTSCFKQFWLTMYIIIVSESILAFFLVSDVITLSQIWHTIALETCMKLKSLLTKS